MRLTRLKDVGPVSQGLAQVHASHNAAPTMSKLSRVFRLVSPARLRILDHTAADSFGVVADHDGVALLQCGRRNLALLIDQQLRGPVQELASRPAVLGLVALQAETDLSYATSLIILSWPAASGGLNVSVNRLTGRPMYAGEIEIDGDVLRFRLDAVRGPGATETSITGALVQGRVEGLEVVSGRTVERMRPTPMEDR